MTGGGRGSEGVWGAGVKLGEGGGAGGPAGTEGTSETRRRLLARDVAHRCSRSFDNFLEKREKNAIMISNANILLNMLQNNLTLIEVLLIKFDII